MSFVNDLKGFINDMLQNVSLLKVKTIRSIGRKPMRLEHDSGSSIEFNADGTIDIIGYTGGGSAVDHGGLSGLGDDDHTQYYNAARHTKAVHDSLGLDHGSLSNLTWSTAGHTIDTDVDMNLHDLDNVADIDTQTGAIGTLGATSATVGSLVVNTAADINANLDMHIHDLDNVADIDAQTGAIGTLGVTTATVGSLIVNTAADMNVALDMHTHDLDNVADIDAQTGAIGTLGVTTATIGSLIVNTDADINAALDMHTHDLDNVADIDAQTGAIGTLGTTTATIGSLIVNTAADINADLDMHTHDIFGVDGFNSDSYKVGKMILTGDYTDQVWLLCGALGGNNECIGNFINQRNSGHYDAINLDVTISTPSTGTDVYGFIGCNHQIDAAGINEFTLVKCTYSGNDYVALRYIGDQYSFTNPMVFTGFFRSTVGNEFLNLATTSVTSVTNLSNVQTKTTIGAANVILAGTLDMGAHDIILNSGILRLNNGTTSSASIGFTTGVQNYIQRQLYSGTDYTLLNDQDYMHTWAILGTEKMHLSTADGLKMYTKINMNGMDINGLATPTLDYDAATKKYVDDNAVTDHGTLTGLSDDDHTQYLRTDGLRTMTGNLEIGTHDINMISGKILLNDGTTTSASIGFTTGVQNYIQRQLSSGSDYTLLSDQDYMHTWAILGTEKMHLSTADGLKMYTGIDMNGLKIDDVGEIDVDGKLYFYNTGTDSTSMYIKRDSTSGNMQFHVPTGKAIEYHVGDGV
jgi:hypothetical protein